MKRNKIKRKYLSLIQSDNTIDTSNNISNVVDKIENKIIKGLISVLWIFLMLFWGAIPVVVLAVIGIDPSDLSYTTKVVITFINDLLFLGLLIGVYYKSLKENFKKYFNHNFKDNIKTSIFYWLIGLCIMMASNYIIAIVMNGQLAENEESVRNLINVAPLYMAFQVAIYAPISEELIFRKTIREVISNKWLFVIISGVIFGGLHAVSSITDMVSMLYLIPYCSLGIILGLLYTKTDNIFSTIVVHSIHNSLALILYLIAL